MSEYKKMKFWFMDGEESLRMAVIRRLESQGYRAIHNIKPNPAIGSNRGINTDEYGSISASTSKKDAYWYGDLADYEEINIDWMRTKKPDTELKAYNELIRIQKDIEDAIKKIKVEE